MSLAYAYNAYEYTGGYQAGGDWIAVLIILCIVACIVAIFNIVLYNYWDWLVEEWETFVDRNRIKTVVIEIEDPFMSILKFDKLTDDVNDILCGIKLPQIGRHQNLNAKNILGFSTVPGKNSNIFTIWYK